MSISDIALSKTLDLLEEVYRDKRGAAYDNAYRANSFHKPSERQIEAHMSERTIEIKRILQQAGRQV